MGGRLDHRQSLHELPREARVLLVDDEPFVSSGDGIRRIHQASFDLCAASAEDAFERLAEDGTFAVVESDDQTPSMNGAEFLSEVAERHPDVSRVMLIGHRNLETVDAVNRGSIFRFLMKPCEPALFRKVVSDAAEQHRLRRAEQDLLRETVQGAVEVLVEVMALSKPAAFGRSRRVQRLVAAAAERLGLKGSWELDRGAALPARARRDPRRDPRTREPRPATDPRSGAHAGATPAHDEPPPREDPAPAVVAAMIAPGREPTRIRRRGGRTSTRPSARRRTTRSRRPRRRTGQARAALADPTRGHDSKVVHSVASAGAGLHRSTLQVVPVPALRSGMVAETCTSHRRSRDPQAWPRGHRELAERLRNHGAAGLLQTESIRVFRGSRLG